MRIVRDHIRVWGLPQANPVDSLPHLRKPKVKPTSPCVILLERDQRGCQQRDELWSLSGFLLEDGALLNIGSEQLLTIFAYGPFVIIL